MERARELRADYKLVGKAFTRKANALVRLNRLEDAIPVYHKALTEHRCAWPTLFLGLNVMCLWLLSICMPGLAQLFSDEV